MTCGDLSCACLLPFEGARESSLGGRPRAMLWVVSPSSPEVAALRAGEAFENGLSGFFLSWISGLPD
jgi:hypothetical protein